MVTMPLGGQEDEGLSVSGTFVDGDDSTEAECSVQRSRAVWGASSTRRTSPRREVDIVDNRAFSSHRSFGKARERSREERTNCTSSLHLCSGDNLQGQLCN